MTGRLAGRTALITGAATGIGHAAAELFARHGARTVLFGLGASALDDAARSLGATAVHGDVTNEADVTRAVESCGGRLDIVLNAAGLIVPDEPLTITDDVWASTLDVNVTGTMRVCRAALPLLRRGGGAIINIASVAAFNSSPDNVSYAASKAAVVSYTRSIAFAHGADGVRANAVAPGWVKTPMSDHEMELLAARRHSTPEAEYNALTERIALRRIAQPSEIASCCLFLASEEASFVTGAVLVVDGGGRSPTQSRAV
ncbi:SDR family oxidoreductase [Bradyrhizobium sp. KB893862 SZCCT0404]|uniref:SDR family NAD(P)-dependent oxidoreductase n=1 Tax=Bradyrhizobium sp. KB893862 SZCCT0404 TaxID=2807672 RepID=UPI001BA5C893|nr:SDR family oxidoreductase [Bradyrhizobium sp. KB893862 SZCCT0404]MBR1177185.1 SDR family oxidoreductase [Bradyrhizobium sp. KB893862 SZCCT0404]